MMQISGLVDALEGRRLLTVLLNEVLVNPPGTDQPFEYIELVGTPGESLSGLRLLSVDGDSNSTDSQIGLIDFIIDVSSVAIGASGFAVVKATSGGHTIPLGTSVVSDSVLDVGAVQTFENSTNSILLVRTNAALQAGDDLDADDDGTIDPGVISLGFELVDAVAFTDNGPTDVTYGGVVIAPAVGRVEVDAATRFSGDQTPLSQSAWTGGEIFEQAALGSASVRYDPTSVRPNMPNTGAITPGAANFASQATSPGAIEFATTVVGIDEAAGTATVNVRRLLGGSGAASVQWATQDDAAVAGQDFVAASGTLNWADGDMTDRVVVVSILDDSAVEPAESLRINLTNITGAALGGRSTVAINISPSDQISGTLLLNEIVVNPPSSPDQPYEYIELRGDSGSTMSNYAVIAVNASSSTQRGTVTLSQDLSSFTVGSNGVVYIGGSGGHSTPAETTFINNPVLNTGGAGLSNDPTAFLLLHADTPFTIPTDIDPSNNGTIVLPPGVQIADSIGWLGTASGFVYGGVSISQSAGTPDAATRFPTNNTANSASAWYGGDLTGTSNSVQYEGTENGRATANQPANAVLTPGGINFGPVVPSITLAQFEFSTAHSITLTGSNLNLVTAGSIQITNTTTSSILPTANLNLVVAPSGTSATISFTGISGSIRPTMLANGNYSLSIATASHTSSFYVLAGDFDRDRVVGFSDLLTLAQHYGTPSGATFATGDADYDGTVSFSDLLILAQNYNVSLSQWNSGKRSRTESPFLLEI